MKSVVHCLPNSHGYLASPTGCEDVRNVRGLTFVLALGVRSFACCNHRKMELFVDTVYVEEIFAVPVVSLYPVEKASDATLVIGSM
ncbi:MULTISPECIES: hypothetical protein [Gynuella]|uniref:hypothetical protein n=1 Tax=Gynuella TaxID=1445504 RepID=UPI001186AD77|nr:hypothetical protein [Gynuella sunshinyii]